MAEDQTGAPVSGAPRNEAAPPAHGFDALIDRWHAESFNNTRLGHDTELWNLVLRAKEDLKIRIAASQEK